MLGLFKGKTKTQRVINSDYSKQLQSALKSQFCQICDKNIATKLAFDIGNNKDKVNSAFTCSNCQLQAVGNEVKNLGQNHLIAIDKFCQILTKEVISYQKILSNTSALGEQAPQFDKQVHDIESVIGKIKEELISLKLKTDQKLKNIEEESVRQNSSFIFQEILKLHKNKRLTELKDGTLLVKHSSVGQKGLRFVDEQELESKNHAIGEKMQQVKKNCKVKLKAIDALTQEINDLTF